ncbi:hypothetical protein [Pseudomonas sp. 50_B]|uniref:hypothetical protein n=1 Tax=Pseudomonas sp. 50_B TaxID=2813574 RepID=UPI001A9F6BA0|nr:hypothetical protein [Pseudomonas sp. 50_B]
MYNFLNGTPAQCGLLTGLLLALSGCQSDLPGTPLSKDEQQRQLETQFYANAVQQVLYRESLRANAEQLMGSVELVMQFDRQNQVIGCAAQSSPLPEARAYPYNPKLGEMLEGVCWNTVFPLAPAAAFEPDGVLEVKGTLMFPRLTLEGEQLKGFAFDTAQYAKGHFFWTHTLAQLPVDSVGVASFEVKADPQGRVQECWVNLRAVRYRPESFKPDNQLRNRVTQLCEQLDLRQMPGFAAEQGQARPIHASVFYTPWKGGPNKAAQRVQASGAEP